MKKVFMILANPFTHDPRVYNEALSLVENGYDVTVFARDRNNSLPIHEIVDGVKVYRVYNNSLISSIPYNLFDLNLYWILGFREASRLFEKQDFNIIHAHDLNTLPIGIRLKRKFKCPLIYDAHEIWGYMVSGSIPWWRYYLYKEKRLISAADHIITVNDAVSRYLEKLSIYRVPVSVIMNAKQLIFKQYSPPKNKRFTILFLGSIDKSRNIVELVESVKALQDVRCIIGGGKSKTKYLREVIKRCEKTTNCEYIGRIPREEVIHKTRKANVIYCLATAKTQDIQWPIDINLPKRFGLANKVFEAMTAGRPVIVAKDTYNGNFVKNIGCGLAIRSNTENIRRTIRRLKHNRQLCIEMGKKGFQAAQEQYNWSQQARRLLSIYNSIQQGRSY